MSEKSVVWLMASRLDVRPGSFRDYYAKVYSPAQFPVDRFNLLPNIDPDPIPTVNIVPVPVYNLSNLSNDWYDRFVHLCDSTAESIYQACGNRTIVIMYSGGIDSTAVLVAMMRNSKFKQFVDSGRLKVSLNSSSIYEYPEFFYETILPTIPLIATDYNTILADPNNFVITGDGGDYVICNTDIPVYENNGTTDIFNMDPGVAYRYFDQCDTSGKFSNMVRGISQSAPFELNTVSQLYWWLGQCFTHQGEMCYPFAWSTVDTTELTTFNRFFRFFLHPEFTTFSFEYMSTNPVYVNLKDMRRFFKDYIINYTGHEQYRNKNKIGSQRIVVRPWHKSAIYGDLSYDKLTTITRT